MNTNDGSSVAPLPVLDLRALRYFVAVAEELHFTRAATRLFVAQQALSRDVQRLERQLGVALFVRTTRRVALTPAGERFLARAREIIALHDHALLEARGTPQPVVVDLLSRGRLTGRRVLDAARDAHPELEFRGRHSGGFAEALADLLAGEVDAAFGRVDGLGFALPAGIAHLLVRFEPLGVLLPEGHRLAALEAVPLAALRGEEIDAAVGNPKAPAWGDLAEQVLALAGAHATPPHVVAEGVDEQAHHLARQGLPILTALDHVTVPGGVLRPLVDPIPIYPVSLSYRDVPAAGRAVDPAFAGVRALVEAAAAVGERERWLVVPAGAWLPRPESTRSAAPAAAGT